MLTDKENWKTVASKESYQFPAVFKESHGNVLFFCGNIKDLPHFTDKSPHFLWSDVQFSKGSSNKDRLIETDIDGKYESIFYRVAPCRGVKQCEQCDHAVGNTTMKNNCTKHPRAPLVRSEGCPVEFVHIYPQNSQNNRQWIGGLCRNHHLSPSTNHHNHAIPGSHNIPQYVHAKIADAVEVNPTLTTSELASGQGLPFLPGSADLSATHYGWLDSVRKDALQKTGVSIKGTQIIMDMEKIADKIDSGDAEVEGSTSTSTDYRQLGRPYMQDFGIIMSVIS